MLLSERLQRLGALPVRAGLMAPKPKGIQSTSPPGSYSPALVERKPDRPPKEQPASYMDIVTGELRNSLDTHLELCARFTQ